jgi:hypothetical protein
MTINQSTFGRKARSACIVTDLPVRLQEKKAARPKLSAESKTIWFGSIRVIVSLSATGEITFEIEPP